MALPTIKSTYSLDPETVSLLERLSKEWNVSKSEVLRRVIRKAGTTMQSRVPEGLDVLAKAQELASLTPARANSWIHDVRAERKHSSNRGTKKK